MWGKRRKNRTKSVVGAGRIEHPDISVTVSLG